MNELIKVNYEDAEPNVSGRSLYELLEVNSNYTTWFGRMCEYGFEEGIDFAVCFPNLESESRGGQNKIDHQLSIPMAKEICMIQRNEKGKMARLYFLELEKKWNTPEAVIARGLQFANRTIDNLKLAYTQLELENAAMKPKVLFADVVSASESTILIGDLAKFLKQNGANIGRNRLFEWLRANKYLTLSNAPTQRSMDMGLFEVDERSTLNNKGDSILIRTTRVTGKGQIYFINKFASADKGEIQNGN